MSVNHSFPVEIFFSKKKTLLWFVILDLALTVIYIVIILNAVNKGKEEFVIWVGTPVYVIAFIFGLRHVLRKRPGIRIDETGVWYKKDVGEGTFVPWLHIQGFRFNDGGKLSKAILIFVSVPGFYAHEVDEPNTLRAAELMWKTHGTPLAIPINFFDETPEKLLEFLQSGMKEFKRN
ncbi:MAG: hypothetical protein IAF38_13740 [Bacteroidia bacterium]|nr:hypothetical protein [Bacteroidia bacterium]